MSTGVSATLSTPAVPVGALGLEDLTFERPADLQARRPAELRGAGRDDVRLLVSTPAGHRHSHFTRLADELSAGDLLVVNDSAVLPASLSALGPTGAFTLNLSSRYAPDLWLAEPRPSPAEPGPLPLHVGDALEVSGVPARLAAPYPGLPRLWFVRFGGAISAAVARSGVPIRYAYAAEAYGLERYQTLFARRPGSAEMPSAARPFSERVVKALERKGVGLAAITLHTGVSSLEVETARLEDHTLYPEPFEVSAETARTLNRVRAGGGRIIAVGTTVVRALETVWSGEGFKAQRGFTRRFVYPGHQRAPLGGLVTGLHDPKASHLALLYALAGQERIRTAYHLAVEQRYLWHEFGDSHLILL